MGNHIGTPRKVLLIATGGTIACRETENGLAPVLDGESLLRELPELASVCDTEVLDLMQRDSTDITAADRMQMARAVWERRGEYDGFVIAHGTDTLACTAALLHHLLPGIDRPVVVTGSMLPMGADGSDAPGNLADALRVAADGRRGVYAVLRGKILRGTNVLKVHSTGTRPNPPKLRRASSPKLTRTFSFCGSRPTCRPRFSACSAAFRTLSSKPSAAAVSRRTWSRRYVH